MVHYSVVYNKGAQGGPVRSYTRDDTDTRQGMTLGGPHYWHIHHQMFGMTVRFKKWVFLCNELVVLLKWIPLSTTKHEECKEI